MNNLVDEIKEELKKDQLTEFWKNYGNYLIGGALAIFLGGAGYFYWDYSQSQRRQELTLLYETTLKETDPKLKADILNQLSNSDIIGYVILGSFEEAEQSQNPAEAYRKIAQDKKIDVVFRDLATLKAVSKEMSSQGDPHALLEEVSAISKKASPWRDLAFELEGSLSLLTGKVDQGLKIFESLEASETAPRGVRQRSHAILDFVRKR